MDMLHFEVALSPHEKEKETQYMAVGLDSVVHHHKVVKVWKTHEDTNLSFDLVVSEAEML